MAETHQQLITQFAAVLASLHDMEAGPSRLCEAGRQMLDADGAALSVITSARTTVLLAATDELATSLEDLQEVVGEGPSKDAYLHSTVQTGNFAATDDPRWTLLHANTARVGFSGTVVAVPLRPAEEVIGTLTAYRNDDQLTVDATTAGFLSAALGTAILQDPQSGLDADTYADVWSSRAQIHQATGMIISQVRVRPEDALALLRGQAFASDTTLLHVAQEILDRRIDFRHFTIKGD